jgi:serine/threonine protein kinase
METLLAPQDARFGQLAVRLHYCTPEELRTGLDFLRRVRLIRNEKLGLPRVMVGLGLLPRAAAELILTYLLKGGPAPPPATPSGNLPRFARSQAAAPEEAALEEATPEEAAPEEDLEAVGRGATLWRGEIKGYKILDVIGQGSMGRVFRAHQVSMDRIVALKVLSALQTQDQVFVQQFLTEARSAGRLNHPNLIRVHEVGKSGEFYYYSMEYVEGSTLNEIMDEFEGGRLDFKRAVNLFSQIAAALDHGFRLGITHRAIRPQSIMITEGDQAKLEGLGLTKEEHTKFLQGENAHYVAPEQIQGAASDTRTDIYSLGCCFFHALTGDAPFDGENPKEVLNARLLSEPPNPKAVNTRLPDDLCAVVRKMMARDPAHRYQTPAELLDSLRRLTFAPSPAVRPPQTARARAGPQATRPVRPVMRRRFVRRRRR